MSKTDRLSLLKSRWLSRRRFVTSTLALAALANSSVLANPAADKDTARRTERLMKERGAAMDDSIADTDKIEATVSRLEFDSETDPHGAHAGSYILSKTERARLAAEVAPFKQFRADVRSLPLRLMA
jgi:hypothetical protein